MSDKEIIERVREDIARISYLSSVYPCHPIDMFDRLPQHVKDSWLETADKILFHRNIAIIDPDAELPPIFYDSGYSRTPETVQQDMLKANFKRVIWQGGQE